VTNKWQKKAFGVKYELDPAETRAADHYCQAKFDNKGYKKDRICGPPKDCHSDHSGQIGNRNAIQIQSAKQQDIPDRADPRSNPSESC
jgi:hypothetical protein